jgi:nucleotide-binding universal stress UspA family protein
MINKILFATDLGAYTSHSLLHVEELAAQFNAKVRVVHAVPPIENFTAAVLRSYCSEQVKQEMLGAPNIDGLLDALRDKIFDLLVKNSMGEIDIMSIVEDIVVSAGQPATLILREADSYKADIIVVGSHGIDALDGRMLGSVATKILQLAKVPVFMVPMMSPIVLSGSESQHQLGSQRLR